MTSLENVLLGRYPSLLLVKCLYGSGIWIVFSAQMLYGQERMGYSLPDTSGWHYYRYDQVARLEDYYKLEKEKGHYEQALGHLEDAYQELDKIHDSILRSNPPVWHSELAAQKNSAAWDVARSQQWLLIWAGLCMVFIGLWIRYYYKAKLSSLRKAMQLELQHEAAPPPIALEASNATDLETPETWLKMAEDFAISQPARLS